MIARGGAVLYTLEILALAVELARYSLDDAHTLRGDARSRVCGSRVTLAVATDDAGHIEAIGARVSACAIGQAAAALFLKSAPGRVRADIAEAKTEIETWLAGGEMVPSWPGIATLASARAFPGRHAAILLPWNAALAALSKADSAD